MSEIEKPAIRPLPEPLPEGEHLLWQGSPAWRPYSRRVFQIDKIAVYFMVIIVWVAVSAAVGGGGADALRSLVWTVPPALSVLLLLAGLALLYARTTVYTITSKRVVIQSGLAFTTAVNLPFSKISSADMKTFSDATGDIELAMSGPRLLYSMIWPNVRLLRLKRPTPMIWALDHPHDAADILGQALAADQQADQPVESAPIQDAEESRPRLRRVANS